MPSYATPERAVAAWLQMVTHARNQRALLEIAPAAMAEFTPDRAGAAALLASAAAEGLEWLDEVAAKRLLAAYGIPVVRTEAATGVDEAVAAAAAIGYPVALKIVSPQIVHKSDIGGVALNLASADEVRQAAQRMLERIAQARPDAVIKGFAVQAMVRRPGAREVIVGLSTDPVFGPVVLCGVGGTEVELHRRARAGAAAAEPGAGAGAGRRAAAWSPCCAPGAAGRRPTRRRCWTRW